MALERSSSRWRAISVPLGALAALAITSNALGAYWEPNVPIPGPAGFITDLSVGGTNVAVGWASGDSHTQRQVWVAESTDRGDPFTRGTRLAADASRAAVPYISLDSGGGRHWAAFAEKRGTPADSTREAIFLANKPFGTGTWDIDAVTPVGDLTRWPNVSHTSGRLFVSYVARIAGTWTILLRSTTNGGDSFDAPTTLGTTSDSPASMDVTARTVSVVWNAAAVPTASGSIRLKQGTIGAAPPHAVTWHPTRTIATGSAPTVASEGHRVAVAYVRNADVFVRVSSDDGETFGRERKLMEGDPRDVIGAIGLQSVDAEISGSRIVVQGAGGVVEGAGYSERAISNDGGAGWSNVVEPYRLAGAQVAFIGPRTAPKVCQAWSEMRFRRQA